MQSLTINNVDQIIEIQNSLFGLQQISNEYDVFFYLPQIIFTNINSTRIVPLDIPLDINMYPDIPNHAPLSNELSKLIFTIQRQDIKKYSLSEYSGLIFKSMVSSNHFKKPIL